MGAAAAICASAFQAQRVGAPGYRATLVLRRPLGHRRRLSREGKRTVQDPPHLDDRRSRKGRSPGHRKQSGEIRPRRSEEHTSELQSLMRNSYAVFCLKTKKIADYI